MIEDKKIEEAAEEIYEDRFLLNGEVISYDNDAEEEMFCDEDIKEAIELGAKWAINEFLKELWHPASEKPKVKQVGDNVTCFVKFKDGSFEACVYSNSWGWSSEFSGHEFIKKNAAEWLCLDDLLKGGNNERA